MNFIYKKHDLYPEQILIRKFEGRVDVNDIIGSWEFLIKNKMVNKHIKGVINELSDCELNMDMERFEILMDYLKKQDCFKGIKLAVVSDSPQIIVFPILGGKKVSNLKIRPFTTMQAAVDWVLMEI